MGLEAEPVKQQDFRPYMAERTAKYQKTAGNRHGIVAALSRASPRQGRRALLSRLFLVL